MSAPSRTREAVAGNPRIISTSTASQVTEFSAEACSNQSMALTSGQHGTVEAPQSGEPFGHGTYVNRGCNVCNLHVVYVYI